MATSTADLNAARQARIAGGTHGSSATCSAMLGLARAELVGAGRDRDPLVRIVTADRVPHRRLPVGDRGIDVAIADEAEQSPVTTNGTAHQRLVDLGMLLM